MAKPERARLTDAIVKRLPTPEKGNKVYYDHDIVGFGARVTAAGARSFILNYVTRGGRERRYTIGSAASWLTSAARAEARRLRRSIDEGGDPLGSSRRSARRPRWRNYATGLSLSTCRASAPAQRRIIAVCCGVWIRPHFGEHTKVQDVDFADIDRLHRKISAAGHPYRANRVVAVSSKMFALAMRWSMRDSNPERASSATSSMAAAAT